MQAPPGSFPSICFLKELIPAIRTLLSGGTYFLIDPEWRSYRSRKPSLFHEPQVLPGCFKGRFTVEALLLDDELRRFPLS